MLKQRIITAIVLLAVLLPALFYASPEPFVLLAMLMIAAGAWEWGRLNACSFAMSLLLGGLCAAACAASWALGTLAHINANLWMVAGAAWVLGGAALLRVGVAGWPSVPRALRLPLGLAALWLAWLAVAQARVQGVNFLLSAMALVWTADISAYFAGRRFGGRFSRGKLAPAISPGKSWEGVWGGMVGVLVLALVWIAIDRSVQPASLSVYSRLLALHPVLLVVALPFLTAMSVVGDLVESLIKRSAGVKDSSNLLPGHGGVLDRVDALLPTMPLVMMLIALGDVAR